MCCIWDPCHLVDQGITLLMFPIGQHERKRSVPGILGMDRNGRLRIRAQGTELYAELPWCHISAICIEGKFHHVIDMYAMVAWSCRYFMLVLLGVNRICQHWSLMITSMESGVRLRTHWSISGLRLCITPYDIQETGARLRAWCSLLIGTSHLPKVHYMRFVWITDKIMKKTTMT